MKLKLKAVGLFVKDMKTMVDFYKDVVGFPIEWDGIDPSVIVELDDIRFYMFGRKDFEEMTSKTFTYPNGINGTLEIALDVSLEEDVDKEFNRMVAAGATPISQPKTYPWGLRSAYVADPEGNLIEIETWDDNWRDNLKDT